MKSHDRPLGRPVPIESLLFEAQVLPQTALCWSCQVICQQVWILNGWKSGCCVPHQKIFLWPTCSYKFCNLRNMKQIPQFALVVRGSRFFLLLSIVECSKQVVSNSIWVGGYVCINLWHPAFWIIGSMLKTIIQIFEWCKHVKITVPELWTPLFRVDEMKWPSMSMFLCLFTMRTFFVYSFCSPHHLHNIWEMLKTTDTA